MTCLCYNHEIKSYIKLSVRFSMHYFKLVMESTCSHNKIHTEIQYAIRMVRNFVSKIKLNLDLKIGECVKETNTLTKEHKTTSKVTNCNGPL